MEPLLSPSQSILGLDIGDARIGVARANVVARLPEPLEVIGNDDNFLDQLKGYIEQHEVGLVVVGIPRNLAGQETKQSENIRAFTGKIKAALAIPVVFVDESMSSKRADSYLENNPKLKVGQDAIAACYILEEYFANN